MVSFDQLMMNEIYPINQDDYLFQFKVHFFQKLYLIVI